MRQDAPDEEEWGEGQEEDWRGPPTVFIVVEVRGQAGARIAEIQRRFDPKLATRMPPHLTLTGSSGVGPIPSSVTAETIRAALAPIAASVRPFEVEFGRPARFMQTNIVVLPIDPHGAIRELHDRVARSGLPFQPAKFTFTPHVTLNFFATLTSDQIGRLLREHVEEPMVVDHLMLSLARDPDPPVVIGELPLLSA